jgi:outer membrane biosynthesis protein TonB
MKRIPMMILVAALLGAAAFSHAGTKASNEQVQDRESVELTFDRNRGKIYAEYARALRSNPKLQGKLVLRIDIGTSGAVTNCRVKFSELNDPVLEAGICSRVRQFQFGPRNAPVSIDKPLDFFPAA